jgi:hypothetical protein
MSLTPDQLRELVNAIAAAPSLAVLERLRLEVEGECRPVYGGFLELLIALRRTRIEGRADTR